MTELTESQVKRLAKVIEEWILEDPDLLEAVAAEQAEDWTLDEYNELFGEPVCEQCGKPLSPVEAMMGPVCEGCTRKNHREVAR